MHAMRPAPLVPGRFGFPLGVASGAAATMLAVAVGATRHPIVSVIAMVVVVDVLAMLTTLVAVVGTMVVCWCLHAGFVLGRQGALALTFQSGHDALVLLLVGLSAVALASAMRSARADRDDALRRIPHQRRGDSVTRSRL